MGQILGQKSKTPKGEISIENNEGRIRLRWRHNGGRYSLSLPYSYTPENMHHATIKVAEIKLDILKNCFDASLERYRPEATKPLIPARVQKIVPIPSIVYVNGLAGKFNDWTKNIRNINIDNSIDYMGVRRVLERYLNVRVEDIAGKIAVENWSASTYNKRLNCLNSFFSWLINTGVIKNNPLIDVKRRRDKKKKKCERREPLTEDQIFAFLEAIRQNTYCHKSAPIKHSFYYPFLKFIFFTGVRNAEAVGLKVKHIDFILKQVEISEALARTTKGTHHAARISKGTKTENIRYLPLSDELSELLIPIVRGKEPDQLVFVSPRGVSIDDRMLQRRILKPVLIKMGFGDRDLYAARHSFGTRAIQQGMPLTAVAYLMGHDTIETTSRNYVHVGKSATALPVISKRDK